MKYRELRLKAPERKMNTSLEDEATRADNEGMKGRIIEFFFKKGSSYYTPSSLAILSACAIAVWALASLRLSSLLCYSSYSYVATSAFKQTVSAVNWQL